MSRSKQLGLFFLLILLILLAWGGISLDVSCRFDNRIQGVWVTPRGQDRPIWCSYHLSGQEWCFFGYYPPTRSGPFWPDWMWGYHRDRGVFIQDLRLLNRERGK